MARRICGEENYPAPLLAVAGHGLPGATRPFPTHPVGDDDWDAVLAAAGTNRITGLLVASIEAEVLPATAPQVQAARSTHRARTARVLALEAQLIAVLDLLAGAAIGARVLKGPAVAVLDYQRPELRSFIDMDVLVEAGSFGRAVRVLSEAGFVRTLAEPRPGFDRRFDKGTTMVSPAGFELDLHRTLVLGPWGVRVKLDDLWDEGAEFVVGGRTLRALSPENRLVHACYHASLGDWPLRLGSLRDIAEMLRDGRLGSAAGLRPATDWGVEAVVAAAIVDARRLLGTDATDELTLWAQRYVLSRRDESWLALHTHADKTFAAQALATVRVLPGIRDKVGYLRALAFPDARYTAGRHTSALGRLRYAVSEAVRGRGSRS